MKLICEKMVLYTKELKNHIGKEEIEDTENEWCKLWLCGNASDNKVNSV